MKRIFRIVLILLSIAFLSVSYIFIQDTFSDFKKPDLVIYPFIGCGILLINLFFVATGICFFLVVWGIVKKKGFQNLTLLFLTIIIFIAIIEYVSYLFFYENFQSNKVVFTETNVSNQGDKYLGYIVKPNIITRRKKTVNGVTVFDYSFRTDEFGRRTIYEKNSDKNQSLILFGGSFLFGEGLEDNQTLHYFLQNKNPNISIYNYAACAYGPSQTLAILEGRNLKEEVSSENADAVYLFLTSHVLRSIGFPQQIDKFYKFEWPYYVWQDGSLKRKGSFIDGRRFISYLHANYLMIKSKSYFLRAIDLNFPLRIRKKHLYFIYKILNRSKTLYEEKFNGEFIVLFDDEPYYSYKETEYLLELLKRGNITVIEYELPEGSEKDDYYIPNDGHPNENLTRIWAEEISEYIKN